MMIFKHSSGDVETLKKSGYTNDIIKGIMLADSEAENFVLNPKPLLGRTNKETMKRIWTYLRKNVRYKADRLGHEVIKSPGYLLSKGYGDCKSFSIATAALLRAFDIEYMYRFVSFKPGNVTHVYIVAFDSSSKKWIPIDCTIDVFGYEPTFWKKIDKKPKGSSISGSGPYALSLRDFFIGSIAVYALFKLKVKLI